MHYLKVNNMKNRLLFKNKLKITLICLFLILISLPNDVWASEAISSTELVENPTKYDEREIYFEGEVVGEALRRGNFAWINVNDDTYAKKNIPEGGKLSGFNSGQSIWLEENAADEIKYFGSYDASGDIIRVNGVFYQACPMHGGDMDIHANTFEIIKPGHPVKHRISLSKIYSAFLIWFVVGLLFFLTKLKSQKS